MPIVNRDFVGDRQGGAEQAPPSLKRPADCVALAGTISAGVGELQRAAAGRPESRVGGHHAMAASRSGMAASRSGNRGMQEIVGSMPAAKLPTAPRGDPWFTLQPQDFARPDVATRIVDVYGEDRGHGRRLYRFPLLFPADHWQSVMPHGFVAWSTRGKRYWSQYSADGRVRHCMMHASNPGNESRRRRINAFAAGASVLREDNGGICDPSTCGEYRRRECDFTGRLLFLIPGIGSIGVFELRIDSFPAMSAAIRTFETAAFLRGGRIARAPDGRHQPFHLTKRLIEGPQPDPSGSNSHVPQWTVELQAPIDVTAVMREGEDAESSIVQAQLGGRIHADEDVGTDPGKTSAGAGEAAKACQPARSDEPIVPGAPTPELLLSLVRACGITVDRYRRYADLRWGQRWMIDRHGRARAWEEVERHRNDPEGYRDKIESVLRDAS